MLNTQKDLIRNSMGIPKETSERDLGKVFEESAKGNPGGIPDELSVKFQKELLDGCYQ